jgi:hypothetical protein
LSSLVCWHGPDVAALRFIATVTLETNTWKVSEQTTVYIWTFVAGQLYNRFDVFILMDQMSVCTNIFPFIFHNGPDVAALRFIATVTLETNKSIYV